MTTQPLILRDLPEVCEFVTRWRQRGETIAFTNGCFDVLHAGHLCLLEQTRQAGGRMIVAVNSDDYCRRVKGVSRPIQEAAVRLHVVAGVSGADAVVEFDEASPERLLAVIRPDVYVLGSDYRDLAIRGSQYCGRIEFVRRVAGLSTTASVAQLHGEFSNDKTGAADCEKWCEQGR